MNGLEQPEFRPNLLRALGLGSATAIVVGNVIGSGIFLKPGTIAAEGGDFRLIIFTWVVGGVLCLLGALCFAELAAMLPQAGGLYVYLKEAYGKPVAFLFGWSEFLLSRPAAIGALSVAFVSTMLGAMGWELRPLPRGFIAATVIGAMAIVNVLGVIWGGRVQNLTTLIKAGGLAFVCLLPLAAIPFGNHDFSFSHYQTSITPENNPSFLSRFGVILLAVMWAYNGWHGVTPVAEEIKDPNRNIPLALFGGLGILIVLYVSANLAYHGVLTMSEMAELRTAAQQDRYAIVAVGQRILGSAGVYLGSGLIVCSVFGAINCNLLVAPRVAFAMGRDGLFPRLLGAVHAEYRTPAIAILAQGILAIMLVLASALVVQFVEGFANKSIFDMLTDMVIFASSIFYTLSVAAVIVLRRNRPQWERPYRTWGYPVVPVLFITFYFWFLSQIFLDKPIESGAGLVTIAAGLIFYAVWNREQNPPPVS